MTFTMKTRSTTTTGGTGISSKEVKEEEVFREEEFDFDAMREKMASRPAPAWEFYAAAETEPVPTYCIERARSDRGKCHNKKICGGAYIAKGLLRAGNLNRESGTYANWMHLKCWRVPSAVWLSFPDKDSTQFTRENVNQVLDELNDVLLTGIKDLTPEELEEVLDFFMDTSNWAKKRAYKEKASMGEDDEKDKKNASFMSAAYPKADPNYKPKAFVPKSEPGTTGNMSTLTALSSSSSSSSSTAVASAASGGESFTSPSGALIVRGQRWPNLPLVTNENRNILQGKTVVMTGVFPETGGGAGLNYGKDSMKKLLTQFGAKVTGSVSGKTDLLVVGKEPGMSKVGEARKRGLPMIHPHELRLGIEENTQNLLVEVASTSLQVTNFSAGFRSYGNAGQGNSIAFRSSDAEVAFAAGVADKARITENGGGTVKTASPEKKPHIPHTMEEMLQKLKVSDLKKKLQELGIKDLTGKKADLIDRILNHSKPKKRNYEDEDEEGDNDEDDDDYDEDDGMDVDRIDVLQLQKLKISDLKKRLQEVGIEDFTGRKADLIDRILNLPKNEKKKKKKKNANANGSKTKKAKKVRRIGN